MLDHANAALLRQLNYQGNYTFAFDDIKLKNTIQQKFDIWKQYMYDWGTRFFIYVHPRMRIKEEVISRIVWCKVHKVNPYVMRDCLCYVSKDASFYNNLAAYCNQVRYFKKVSPKLFIEKRIKNKNEQNKFLYYLGAV